MKNDNHQSARWIFLCKVKAEISALTKSDNKQSFDKNGSSISLYTVLNFFLMYPASSVISKIIRSYKFILETVDICLSVNPNCPSSRLHEFITETY